VLARGLRKADLLSRTGPYELSWYSPSHMADGAVEVAERARINVQESVFTFVTNRYSNSKYRCCQFRSEMDTRWHNVLSYARQPWPRRVS